MKKTLKGLLSVGLIITAQSTFAAPKPLCLPGTQAAPDKNCEKVILNANDKQDKCEKYYYKTYLTKSKTRNKEVYMLCTLNDAKTSDCTNGPLQCKMPPFTPASKQVESN